jgi:hypothetical protein
MRNHESPLPVLAALRLLEQTLGRESNLSFLIVLPGN